MSIENSKDKDLSIDEQIDKEQIDRWEDMEANKEYPDWVYREGIDYGNATGY